MKIGYVIRGGLILAILIGGSGFYLKTFNAYKEIASSKKVMEETSTKMTQLQSSIAESSAQYAQNYTVPADGALYDFVSKFQEETGATVSKIVGKRYTGTTSTTVASVESIDEVHQLKGIDVLELIIENEDSSKLLDAVNSGKYGIDKATIYPIDGKLILDFIVIGGL